jgi:hypothetical protein
MTPHEIAERLTEIADTLGCANPTTVRAELHDLAALIIADSPAGQLARRRLSILAPVERDEDAPFPKAPAAGWTHRVSRQADGLWRVVARNGARVLTRPNLSANAVVAFDAAAEWGTSQTALRRSGGEKRIERKGE